MEVWKKILHTHKNEKKIQAGVAVLILDKIYFKTMIVTKDKEEHYIMIKVFINEEVGK